MMRHSLQMDIILDWVIPAAGALLTVILCVAAVPTAFSIHKSRRLGSFNPLPYPPMVLQNICWILYSMELKFPTSVFIFIPNWIGFIGGVYIIGTVYPLCRITIRNLMLSVLILGAVCFPPALFLFLFYSQTSGLHQFLGFVAVGIQLIFFASPLSAMAMIIRRKNSSCIHVGLAISTAIAGLFWTIYGICIGDLFLIIPNSIGGILGCIQIILKSTFRNGAHSRKITWEEGNDDFYDSISEEDDSSSKLLPTDSTDISNIG